MRPAYNKDTVWKSKALLKLLIYVKNGVSYARDISKHTNIKAGPIGRQLKKLESMGLIKSERLKLCNINSYGITDDGLKAIEKHDDFIGDLVELNNMLGFARRIIDNMKKDYDVIYKINKNSGGVGESMMLIDPPFLGD